MDNNINFDLSNEERELLRLGVLQWIGPSTPTEELAQAIGFEGTRDLFDQTPRIHDAIKKGDSLPPEDWTRALLSAEINFSSHLFGCGEHWTACTAISDEDAIRVLRSLQFKLRKFVIMIGTRPSRR